MKKSSNLLDNLNQLNPQNPNGHASRGDDAAGDTDFIPAELADEVFPLVALLLR